MQYRKERECSQIRLETLVFHRSARSHTNGIETSYVRLHHDILGSVTQDGNGVQGVKLNMSGSTAVSFALLLRKRSASETSILTIGGKVRAAGER